MGVADVLGALNEAIRNCTRCRLAESRINALCGEGRPDANLMLIAQAPGRVEDKEGSMFIGPSGKVLDELLQLAHIDRKEVYMTNLVKCMLPKYRRPKSDEIAICSRYLKREIALVHPTVMASLGFFATRYLFEKYELALPPKPEFRGVYGKIVKVGDNIILPLQHPAAVLYNDAIKDVMVQNYLVLGEIFTELMKNRTRSRRLTTAPGSG
ncbi:MAG: uracil-DNA glycosylase [Desulfosarcina sp.]|nr:uracil-DNA glycosylase [Desulfosarcina sp.]MBC2766159.1 uracil-DNA glycosylase [Desulfosarcina sp.]